MKGIFSKLKFNMLRDLRNDLPFLPERMKIQKVGKYL